MLRLEAKAISHFSSKHGQKGIEAWQLKLMRPDIAARSARGTDWCDAVA